MKKKTVLLDVNPSVNFYLNGRLDGIGRTNIELTNALYKLKDELPFDIALFSQNMKGLGAHNMEAGFKKKHLYLPKRDKFDRLSAFLRLRELMTGYDIMHITHNYDVVAHPDKCVVTVHDAMFFTFSEDKFNPEFCRKYYTDFAQKCKSIITCSESSKQDIVKHMGVEPDKVNVCYWGVKHNLFYPRTDTTNKYCDTAPYFISSSCDEGRKNTISVIRAFAKYRVGENARHHLVLVWRRPPQNIVDEIAALGITEYVHFASNIADEELAALYSSATACLFPSLYEGFGLPILESMASGTPVVTCRNSSLPEVGGDTAIYVDPYDIDGMSHYMSLLETDAGYRADLEKKSVRQASNFTWENCAHRTIEVYKNALGL